MSIENRSRACGMFAAAVPVLYMIKPYSQTRLVYDNRHTYAFGGDDWTLGPGTSVVVLLHCCTFVERHLHLRPER